MKQAQVHDFRRLEPRVARQRDFHRFTRCTQHNLAGDFVARRQRVALQGTINSQTLFAIVIRYQAVIGFHTPGDIVGLDAIESGRYVCNALVLDTSCVCPLPNEALCRLSARSPGIQRRLIEKMSRKIVDHEGLLLILGQKTAEQRMAAFLLHHSNKQRQLGLSEVDINLPMSRAASASYLALAVETVSRVLTRLQESGLLNVQRARVQRLNLDNLAIIAEEAMEAGFPARRRASSLH